MVGAVGRDRDERKEGPGGGGWEMPCTLLRAQSKKASSLAVAWPACATLTRLLICEADNDDERIGFLHRIVKRAIEFPAGIA